jgi:hypothetical protein
MMPKMGLDYEMRVAVTIDASKLGFTDAGGVRVSDLEIQVYCGDARERVVGQLGRRLTLRADEETLADFQQNGVRHVLRVPVNQPPKFVKVVVYDHGSDRVGSAIKAIK